MRDASAVPLTEDRLTAQAAAPVGTFASLRIRDFRWLWIGTVCTSIGQWVQQVTLGWVVYDLTGSGTLLQLTVPDHLRARVMGLLMLNIAFMPLGALVAGVGADVWGPQVITRGMAGLAGAIGMAVLIASPTMRRFRLREATAIAAAHGRQHVDGS